MPSPDRHHFIPKDELEIRRPMPGGGGMPMPMGTNTGDLLVWNATTGAWEVLAKPDEGAMLVAGADGMPEWLAKPPGLAVLVAGVDGVPVWATATAKGALIGDGTNLSWLSSIGHDQWEYLSLDANAVPEWFT